MINSLLKIGEQIKEIYGNEYAIGKVKNSSLLTSNKTRIEPAVDLTNVKSVEGVFHNNVEIEVTSSLKELLTYYNFNVGKITLEEFLIKYDPFFQRVLLELN